MHTQLPTYMHTYILEKTHMRIYFFLLLTSFLTYSLPGLHLYLPTYIHIIYLPTNVLTYLHTYLLTYKHTHTYQHCKRLTERRLTEHRRLFLTTCVFSGFLLLSIFWTLSNPATNYVVLRRFHVLFHKFSSYWKKGRA